MKYKTFPIWLILSVFIIIIVIIASIGLYTWNFWGYSLSNNPDNWGVAGDYFGGVLNPLLGVTNILLLFYLTKLVSEQERIRHLNSFRFEAYNNLKKVFSKHEFNWTNISNEEEVKIKVLKDFLLDFMENDQFIFEESENHLDKAVQDVIDKLEKLLDIHEEYKVEMPAPLFPPCSTERANSPNTAKNATTTRVFSSPNLPKTATTARLVRVPLPR
ncbi:MAG: hypothetical protein ACKVT2_21715 [Saprospiraceae bacterium]